MRRCLACVLTTILVLGMVQGARAQWSTPRDQSQPRWWQRMWPFHKKEAPPPLVAASPVESPVARKTREQAIYFRRIAVCDKLKDIAFQTKDDELLRKADQLDQRAFAIYQQHTGQAAAGSGLQADEGILDRRLGASAPTAQSLLPAQRASGSRASLKED